MEKKIVFSFLFLFIICFSQEQDSIIVHSHFPISMIDKGKKIKEKFKIPADSEIIIYLNYYKGGFFKARYQNITGYISKSFIPDYYIGGLYKTYIDSIDIVDKIEMIKRIQNKCPQIFETLNYLWNADTIDTEQAIRAIGLANTFADKSYKNTIVEYNDDVYIVDIMWILSEILIKKPSGNPTDLLWDERLNITRRNKPKYSLMFENLLFHNPDSVLKSMVPSRLEWVDII
ncbi:hypothetical protein KJ762_00915 [bacterium]|nr:hypothetical protein [bacterium]MBU1063257.1 hypothetical protein [bacterium]MBU1633050.1 hypothetical protein [bacterium]MBU1873976.1 hypothetical protein [bacterium]